MNTTDSNKLIAEFMGRKIISIEDFKNNPTEMLTNTYLVESLSYHKDWYFLFTVVEKIESLGYWTEIVGGYHFEFRLGLINDTRVILSRVSETRLEAVYDGVVAFIKMYYIKD